MLRQYQEEIKLLKLKLMQEGSGGGGSSNNNNNNTGAAAGAAGATLSPSSSKVVTSLKCELEQASEVIKREREERKLLMQQLQELQNKVISSPNKEELKQHQQQQHQQHQQQQHQQQHHQQQPQQPRRLDFPRPPPHQPSER